MENYKIILFYKYTFIDNTEKEKAWQKSLCEFLNLKGRLIIAHEGINGTFEGTEQNINEYVEKLRVRNEFKDIHIKISDGIGDAFPRLSIKIRPEIVSLHLGNEDFSPTEVTGKYITAEELHELLENKQEFYLIDMRNDYEHKVGYFENSILPKLSNFRDLPAVLKDLEHLKNKKVITVCTGGVRCEKASGYLIKKGFKDVSQLYGGIVTYMEKYPNQNFLGDLYVFDKRVVMSFNADSPEHKIVGKCEICGKNSNNYVNCVIDECHKHFICCENCVDENGKALCNSDHSNIMKVSKKSTKIK